MAWLPYDTEVFSNRYIDPFDVGYLREFQRGIEVQHGQKLLEQISNNLATLEKVAAAVFRLVSTQVKGTSPEMRVDPYSISLAADAGAGEIKHANGLLPDTSIANDVAIMWFYRN